MNTYRYHATNNHIMIELDQAEERPAVSQHDLLLPANTQRWKCTGMVVSAGPTCRIPGLGPGVRLLISPYGVGNKALGPDRKEYRVALDHQFLGYFDDAPAVDEVPAAV